MAILLPNGKQQFTDSAGLPLSGGLLYTFAAGTNVPQATYSDAAGTLPNTNPIVLDGRGEAVVFWDGNYKVSLRTPLNVPIWTIDNITSIDPLLAQFNALNATLIGPGGLDYLGFKVPGAPYIKRSAGDKVAEEISLFDVDGIYQHMAAIRAGSYTADLSTVINLALQNGKRIIVRNGDYYISNPVLLALNDQQLEFEDHARFIALDPTKNGIACPHGILNGRVTNATMVGCATASTGHSAILWNSNAAGSAPYGSTTSDDMGGLVEYLTCYGVTPGVSSWNNFVVSNMAGGFKLRHWKGKGIIGTASGYGYGHIFSGDDVESYDGNYDGLIAGQGRHVVYGSFCRRFNIEKITGKNAQSSGIALNTDASILNAGGNITNISLDSVTLQTDTSRTSGALEFNFQAGATQGGSRLTVSNIRLSNIGTQALYCRGYSKVDVTDLTCDGWGQAQVGSIPAYNGMVVYVSDDVTLTNCKVSSAINQVLSSHFYVQESQRCRINGGEGNNTGAGAQRAVVTLNTTGIGTPDALIDRVKPILSGGGSWSIGAWFDNPTQTGSTMVPYKTGRMASNAQTGANITIDAREGETMFILDPGATSILQILPAAEGQTVTLKANGNVSVLPSWFYTAGAVAFNMTANDAITLRCFSSNGASSLWVELGRSIN